MKNKTDDSAYMKLYKQIKKNIVDGVYPYNTKIPSKRTLASEAGVSVISVEHAYDLLRDEGYIRSVEKSGYFVDFRATDGFSSFPEEMQSVNTSFDSNSDRQVFPVSVLSKTMRNILTNRQDEILLKSPNAGLPEFREAISKYLARNKDIHIDPSAIVIGSGAEYLYNLIAGLTKRSEKYIKMRTLNMNCSHSEMTESKAKRLIRQKLRFCTFLHSEVFPREYQLLHPNVMNT